MHRNELIELGRTIELRALRVVRRLIADELPAAGPYAGKLGELCRKQIADELRSEWLRLHSRPSGRRRKRAETRQLTAIFRQLDGAVQASIAHVEPAHMPGSCTGSDRRARGSGAQSALAAIVRRVTSVLTPGFTDCEYVAVGDWMPARYTPSLSGSEDFTTQGDKLLSFADRHWSIAEVIRFQLDHWQRWLVRHVLETYPDDWPVEHLRGQLRFRQVVISMGRQNGKSLLGALFVLYFLALHMRGPRVIGMASIDRQAKIVYDRVKYGIDRSRELSRELHTTRTRGITRRDGSGMYQTLPAKEDSAQGEPASGALYDELHLGLAALWDALVLAQRARRNSLLIGITTAGDESSDLLIRLYDEGEAAIAGQDERFGFFCWEAEDRELTEANVIRANPAIACGRVPLDVAMADARKMWNDEKPDPEGLTGRQRCIRYTLNRFIEGSAGGWIPLHSWTAIHGQPEIVSDVTYGIERTPSWEYAFITATTKVDGKLQTEPVASIVAPTQDQLRDIALKLNERTAGGATFAMDSLTLRALADELKESGLDVWKLGAAEVAQACQLTAGRIARGTIVQSGDELLRRQMGRAKRRDTGDGWRVSRSLSAGDVDAVIATIAGCYVADVKPPKTTQLF